jgi:hypothetical protein
MHFLNLLLTNWCIFEIGKTRRTVAFRMSCCKPTKGSRSSGPPVTGYDQSQWNRRGEGAVAWELLPSPTRPRVLKRQRSPRDRRLGTGRPGWKPHGLPTRIIVTVFLRGCSSTALCALGEPGQITGAGNPIWLDPSRKAPQQPRLLSAAPGLRFINRPGPAREDML